MQAQELSVQGNDVEANLCRRRDDLRIIRGDAPELRAFSRVHGLKRPTQLPGITPLSFADHQRGPVEANGIDFAAGNAHVASQHAVTARGKIVARPVLALSP